MIDPHLDRPLVPQNIVGSADVKFPIRLEGIMYKHSLYSSVSGRPVSSLAARPAFVREHPNSLTAPLMQYEPELFPGLIYRMVDPKIVLLIFVSGKVVLTGGKVRRMAARRIAALAAYAFGAVPHIRKRG